VTIFLALSPLTAAALGAWWLGEPVTRGVLAGFGCVALGTWLATSAPAPGRTRW
jgi:drug/metabolite transporter (DMT)-like permease